MPFLQLWMQLPVWILNKVVDLQSRGGDANALTTWEYKSHLIPFKKPLCARAEKLYFCTSTSWQGSCFHMCFPGLMSIKLDRATARVYTGNLYTFILGREPSSQHSGPVMHR